VSDPHWRSQALSNPHLILQINHTKSMHTSVKECGQCGFQCSGKEGLSKHIAECHPQQSSLYHQCSECGKNYPSENACKIHIAQEHTTVSCQVR